MLPAGATLKEMDAHTKQYATQQDSMLLVRKIQFKYIMTGGLKVFPSKASAMLLRISHGIDMVHAL